MNEEDGRIEAWHEVAAHPFFSEAYKGDGELLPAMIAMLDGLMAKSEPVAKQAEEPVEWRLLRAFTNGYTEGLRRGAEGRLDR